MPASLRLTVGRAVAALALLCAVARAGDAQPPVPAGAAAVTPARFAGLRWLEGRWRGQLPGGGYFYESYEFADDSTILVHHYADSTLAARGQPGRVELRGGVVRYARATATRLTGDAIHFAVLPDTVGGFVWARTADGWTATIRDVDQDGRPYTIVYRMEPMPGRPEDAAPGTGLLAGRSAEAVARGSRP